jgi:hypothetical protein
MHIAQTPQPQHTFNTSLSSTVAPLIFRKLPPTVRSVSVRFTCKAIITHRKQQRLQLIPKFGKIYLCQTSEVYANSSESSRPCWLFNVTLLTMKMKELVRDSLELDSLRSNLTRFAR